MQRKGVSIQITSDAWRSDWVGTDFCDPPICQFKSNFVEHTFGLPWANARHKRYHLFDHNGLRYMR